MKIGKPIGICESHFVISKLSKSTSPTRESGHMANVLFERTLSEIDSGLDEYSRTRPDRDSLLMHEGLLSPGFRTKFEVVAEFVLGYLFELPHVIVPPALNFQAWICSNLKSRSPGVSGDSRPIKCWWCQATLTKRATHVPSAGARYDNCSMSSVSSMARASPSLRARGRRYSLIGTS